MKKQFAAITMFLVSLNLASMRAEELEWSNRKGESIRARFVGLSGKVLTVAEDGASRKIPIEKLSAESVRQARELAAKQNPDTTGGSTAIELSPVEIEGILPMKHVLISVSPKVPAGLARQNRMRPKVGLPGTFQMGSPKDEPGREDWEPLHSVILKGDFFLKSTEVTWKEWDSVRRLKAGYDYTDLSAGTNGHRHGTRIESHPVLDITWWDALKWCNLLSQIKGLTPVYYHDASLKIDTILKTGTPEVHVNWEANGYRLPTEAEWEFACRSGTSKHPFPKGKNKRNLEKVGWFFGNSGKSTHPVEKLPANDFGLYDMHGNAAEWCWDWFGELGSDLVTDPRGAETGTNRVIRGGSWMDPAKECRAASRGSRSPTVTPNPSVGFRTARTVVK